MRLISVLLVALTFAGCVYDPPTPSLAIHNNSNSSVYVYQRCSNTVEENLGLKSFLPGSGAYKIEAHSYGELYVYGSHQHKKVPCMDQDHITLFFISSINMEGSRWAEKYHSQLYQKKIFTTAQLDSLDWTINYTL